MFILFFLLVFFSAFSLRSEETSIVQEIAAAIICSFLSLLVLTRGRLYYFVKSSVYQEKNYFKSRILLSITSFYIVTPAYYGVEVLSSWWLSLLALILVLDPKDHIAKMAWRNRSILLKKYECYSALSEIPLNKIEQDSFVVNVFYLMPVLTFIYIGFIKAAI